MQSKLVTVCQPIVFVWFFLLWPSKVSQQPFFFSPRSGGPRERVRPHPGHRRGLVLARLPHRAPLHPLRGGPQGHQRQVRVGRRVLPRVPALVPPLAPPQHTHRRRQRVPVLGLLHLLDGVRPVRRPHLQHVRARGRRDAHQAGGQAGGGRPPVDPHAQPVPPRRQAGQHPRLQVGLFPRQALRLWVRQDVGGHCDQEERAPPLLPSRAGGQARQRVLSGGRGGGALVADVASLF